MSDTQAPINLINRIDDLLREGLRLTKEDTHQEAISLHHFAWFALVERTLARLDGKSPPAPLGWLDDLAALADWIGWS